MAKADADNAHAGLERLGGVLDELDDPRVVIKGCVSGAGDEDGVNVPERRVRVQVVDDVVARDLQTLLGRQRRVRGATRRVEERREDARVATELVARLRLRRVGFEDGEAKAFGVCHGGGVILIVKFAVVQVKERSAKQGQNKKMSSSREEDAHLREGIGKIVAKFTRVTLITYLDWFGGVFFSPNGRR